MSTENDSRTVATAPLLVLFFLLLFLLHIPLLRLPYYWDEAGYYIPAARDLLLTGSLIPHSTPSNAHPPLLMVYLALAWKLSAYAPVVTRTAMLLVAGFTLLGVFRLAQRIANTEVAVASTLCTALYPVFFAQSSLAHLDLAAAGFSVWGLLAYVQQRPRPMLIWFSLAALTKETAILAPIGLLAWGLFSRLLRGRTQVPVYRPGVDATRALALRSRESSALLAPLLPLALWYAYHYLRTGFVFGNPEFFRYNVQETLHPLRILLALGLRAWQVLGYLNLYFLSVATALAVAQPPIRDGDRERPRIAHDVQFAFLAVIVTYLAAMSVIGGAVLARYLLPVLPLVIIISISTLWRRVRYWGGIVGIVTLTFVAALFVNPPYGFSPEDNLAYRDYIALHQRAETFLEARYPMACVLTAWPASDEITRPYLGYVTRPMRVFRVEDFSAEQMLAAAELHSRFDAALVFSTKYEPPHPWFRHWRLWQRWKNEFFGYHRDLPPAAAAQILGGRLVYTEYRAGQWVGVIEMSQVQEARAGRLSNRWQLLHDSGASE